MTTPEPSDNNEEALKRIFEDDSPVTIIKPPIAVDKDFPKR